MAVGTCPGVHRRAGYPRNCRGVLVAITEYPDMPRNLTITLIQMAFDFPRDRGYRITQIADQYGMDAEPVAGGLFRVFANGDGTYTVEDHRG
jgi:hypothetical protein